jgi:hypothetical protein
MTATEERTKQLLRLAREAEVRALTRPSPIDRRDDLEEARLLRASAAAHLDRAWNEQVTADKADSPFFNSDTYR